MGFSVFFSLAKTGETINVTHNVKMVRGMKRMMTSLCVSSELFR
jgi:hypothetical protein